ncbi:MAG: OmpA family protein [Bacteroidia bacterium]|jgi:flagellar motor protein MotB|nr:OmpA family protein [Bacteroidia bacterium]GIV24231.1 MAG: hypothetical protein KatS3mg025_1890 [Bacteroidia bacterium]
MKIIGWIVLQGLVWAQVGSPPHEKYLSAVAAARRRDTVQAIQLLREVLTAQPSHLRAAVYLGRLYLDKRQYSALRAIGWSLVQQGPSAAVAQGWGVFFLGSAYTAAQQEDSLDMLWRRFVLPYRRDSLYILRSVSKAAEKGKISAAALQGIASSGLLVSDTGLLPVPVPFFPSNLGPNVNTPYSEYFPSLTADSRRLYFTTTRPKPGRALPSGEQSDEDIYWCEGEARAVTWGPPTALPINTDKHEGASFFSSDGQTVIFGMCHLPEGYGDCDMYVSRLHGTVWSKPVNLGPVINTKYWDTQPCLSADGKRLYFASDRPGGMGGADIWYSDWKDGQWQPPVNLGPPINTREDEYNPFIAADGKTLYFGSTGHPGYGGRDMFFSVLTSLGWSEPKNLGYPFNTEKDEKSLFVDTRGEYAYVALERPEGKGREDIYVFRLWPEIKPVGLATYVRGQVIDAKSRAPLGATIKVVDIESRDTVRSLTSNQATGEFILSLPLGRRYACFAESPGYLFYSGHFDLSHTDTVYNLLIPLQKVEKGASLTLRNVFFDFDKATLRPESEVELREVARLLRENPRWRVEVQGHTDSIGTASYNQTLSQRRAEAVRTYLIEQGIAAERITARGYGFTRPVATNRTGEGRALNRRTEIVFVE